MAKILLIDDDSDFAEFLRETFTDQGHAVRWLAEAEDGLRLLTTPGAADLVLLDNKMPRMTGLEFLAALKKQPVRPEVILMTGSHHDQTVIQATNLGAYAYVIKPADPTDLGELRRVVAEALEVARRPDPVPIASAEPDDADESVIVGHSKAILGVLMRLGRCAQLDETVLILGETGTGKDLVARAIHTNSPRRQQPFVVMNCTALNENLLDDELFGHEVGAFTGADKLRKGRFEHAHGGTLFLDEVGDMPLTLQAKLLRVLENREVVRVGSNDPIKVDVRVVAATHKDLKALVAEGRFRQDLYYRLEGIILALPPLRERREDIERLARRFLVRLFGGGAACPVLHPDALERLRNHPWPGNIRQLQKVLCRAAGTCRDPRQIMPDDLNFGDADAAAARPPADDEAAACLRRLIELAWQQHPKKLLSLLQKQLECELLRFGLAQPGMSQVKLSDRLGVARNTLRARIEEFGLHGPELEE
jgi:DNA-binding NtrC family response regulator